MSEREFEEFLRKLSEHLGREVSRDAIAGELRDHLEEQFAELSQAGVSRDEAVRLALDECGEAPALAEKFADACGQWRRRRVARWSRGTVVILALGILVLWAMWPDRARVPLAPRLAAQAESEADKSEFRLPEAEAKVERALAETAWMDFVEAPLSDVLDYLSDLRKVPITLDLRSLEANAMTRDMPVTLQLRDMRLETLLDRLTKEVGLIWTYRDEAIEVTTADAEESQVFSRVYDIHDLLTAPAIGDVQGAEQQGAEIVRILSNSIEPNQWSINGGRGNATVNEGALIVTHAWRTQRRIRQFLVEARTAAALTADQAKFPRAVVPASLPLPLESDRKIDLALQKTADVDFTDTSLSDVVAFLQDQQAIPFALDKRALEDAGLAEDTPVTIKSKGSRLHSLLNRLTRNLGLTWTVAHESIVITLPEVVESKYTTPRLYPVGDLVTAEDQESRSLAVERLIQLIKGNIGRSSSAGSGWVDEGGIGSIGALAEHATIVIGQTDSVHREVEKLLADLRSTRRKDAAALNQPNPRGVVVQVYFVRPQDGSEKFDLAPLEEMIKAIVEPDSWRNEPQAYVQHVGNRLVVRQTPACQRKIAKFLTTELKLNVSPNWCGNVNPGPEPTGGGGGGFF